MPALILSLTILLTACSPAQVTAWFSARGHTIDQPTAAAVARWTNTPDGLNAAADHAARHNGARGTCSPTGIFYAESGGNWWAQNPRSTASGGFQFLDSTWARHRGYAKARLAPPWVQWERFLQTWAGGAGRSHWTESVC